MTIPLTPLIRTAHQRGLSFGATVIVTNSTPFDDLRNRPPIPSLRERDIDLLICSELHFPESPIHQLFVSSWNGAAAEFAGAWVSYYESNGETDILAAYKTESMTLILLIEDKIDADFQPEQPERYRDRAESWLAGVKTGIEIETVLLAPDAYFETEGSEVFDRRVSYEDVIIALAESSDSRTSFLAKIMKEGIESHRKGYVKQHNEARTRLWHSIWEIASDEMPQLRMPNPGSKGRKSGFVHFKEADGLSDHETRRRVEVVYKMNSSNVDLQFQHTSIATLRDSIGHLLDSDMILAQTDKSASIRLSVPSITTGVSGDALEDAIRQGLLASERLRQFFIENRLLELIPSV